MESFSQRSRHLDGLKARLDVHRPLPEATLRSVREDMAIRLTYHSNAIEGNTLTLQETRVVLEGITIAGRSVREHLEAVNHRQAIDLLEDFVTRDEALSERLIREIHQIILQGIDRSHAGIWRPVNVLIAGARHRPSDALLVPEEMSRFVAWYHAEGATLHPVERAARVHADFVKIHPFVDGNGRTSRLLMNLELMRAGFPAAIIPVERRLDYYQALDQAHVDGDYAPFLDLVCDVVEASFDVWWSLLPAT